MAIWSLTGKAILIVDDFAEMRSAMRGMVESYGADNISTAATGEEAINLISGRSFDIIFCDYNLGEGKDGQQVLEECKHRRTLPYSSVFIMVTAESTSSMVMGALEYQPDDYLTKPFTRTVLQARIQRQLEKKEGLVPLARAIEQHNNQKIIALCDKHISDTGRNRHELLKLKCDTLIDEQEYDQAKAICEAILKERDLPWPHLCLGKIHYQLKAFQEAADAFSHILEENASYLAAYDWLAKAQRQLGDTTNAQQTLQKAIEWSPKSVIRQRALAEVCESNQDFNRAEQARRKTLRIGKNSVLRSVNDFTDMVKLQSEHGNPKDAIKTLELFAHEFKNNKEARLAGALSKSKVYIKLGLDKKGADSAREAGEIFASAPSTFSNELATQLTDSLLKCGATEQADKVMSHLVKNNHDNQALLDEVARIYKDADVETDINDAIASHRKEIISSNNQGAKLLDAGDIDQAIALFEKALQAAPNNPVLNANTAHAYIISMRRSGADTSLMEKTRQYLDKAADYEKLKQRYKALNTAYWKLYND